MLSLRLSITIIDYTAIYTHHEPPDTRMIFMGSDLTAFLLHSRHQQPDHCQLWLYMSPEEEALP